MLNLELKIPPLLIVAIVAGLMTLVAYVSPNIHLPWMLRYGTVAILIFSSFIFALSGLYSMFSAKTTVNPHKPKATSHLVTTGIYEYTRNPMYISFALWLIAWPVYLSNIWCLLLFPVFIGYMSRYQIIPEEKTLAELFGNDFIAYKNSVRRWL